MAKTTTNNAPKKLDAVEDDDDIFYYIGVRASPFATDCAVFGLPSSETLAIRSRFPVSPGTSDVVNGIMIKGSPFAVINALAELGYRVICSTGEAEILWTMQREL